MAAAEYDGTWIDLQREREQRMRYEVLALLFRLSGEEPGPSFHAMDLGEELGVWKRELYRVLDWLSLHGFVSGWGAGPEVSITLKGTQFIRRAAGARSIPDEA